MLVEDGGVLVGDVMCLRCPFGVVEVVVTRPRDLVTHRCRSGWRSVG